MNWKEDEEFCTAYNNFTCEYIPAQIELAYYFWKVSRENIKVKLPYTWVAYEEGCSVVDLEFMLQALDEAGVKY